MGEYSKRVGEIGEEVISDFLKLIGWKNPRLNFDIPSVDPEKHEKKTNGIDGFFHYESPMITNTIENIIFSIKFSSKDYKSNPVPQFKEYYIDLAKAIESFKKSDIRTSAMNKHSNIESIFDRGILFWINNTTDRTALNGKLIKIEIPKGYNHDGIILMDNSRIEFIFDSINFIKNKYREADIEFSYFSTSMNNDDPNTRNGNVLPFQYMSSNILPFRIQDKNTSKVTLAVCTRDNFDDDELMKIMGLAHKLGNNFQSSTDIYFPDFNKLNNEQTVETIKQAFDDNDFTENLKIGNYNSSFLNQ